jgi:predicted  nucleic acid-binding Zn-ribbon protein
MPETINTRVTRLENLMGRLAEKQEKLDDVLVLLTEAQIKTEERFQETERRFQRTDARMEELAKAQLQTGERIEHLVSAIGELLRNGRAK